MWQAPFWYAIKAESRGPTSPPSRSSSGSVGADTITLADYIDWRNYSIDLTRGELTVAESLTIMGQPDATIDAQGNSRIFLVRNDYDYGACPCDYGTFTIDQLTLTGGKTYSDGGAIESTRRAKININRSTITGNSAGRDGGGVHAYIVYLNSSQVLDNQAGRNGGGISAFYRPCLFILNHREHRGPKWRRNRVD